MIAHRCMHGQPENRMPPRGNHHKDIKITSKLEIWRSNIPQRWHSHTDDRRRLWETETTSHRLCL